MGAGAPNTKFEEAIKNEHTTEAFGCDIPFTTGNYLVTTTPRKEFEIAMGQRDCPEEDMLDRKGGKVRVKRSIHALTTLKICWRAGLKRYEILAVVRARELIYPGEGREIFCALSHSSAAPGLCPGTLAYAPRRVHDHGGCDIAPQHFDGAGGH